MATTPKHLVASNRKNNVHGLQKCACVGVTRDLIHQSNLRSIFCIVVSHLKHDTTTEDVLDKRTRGRIYGRR